MTCVVSQKLLKKFKLDGDSLYFSIAEAAAEIGGTSAALRGGEWLTVNELLYAMMLPSGNDAALALAENFGCILYFNNNGQSSLF